MSILSQAGGEVKQEKITGFASWRDFCLIIRQKALQ